MLVVLTLSAGGWAGGGGGAAAADVAPLLREALYDEVYVRLHGAEAARKLLELVPVLESAYTTERCRATATPRSAVRQQPCYRQSERGTSLAPG